MRDHVLLARQQAGFNLVELLVALTIGLFMLLTLVSFYDFSRETNSQQNRLAEMQDNLRFAGDYIANQVRGSGLQGCAFDPQALIPQPSVGAANAIIPILARQGGIMGADALDGAAPTLTYIDPSDIPNSPKTITDADSATVGYKKTFYTTKASPAAPIPDRLYVMTVVSGPHFVSQEAAVGATSVQVSTTFPSPFIANPTRFALVISCADGGRADLFKISEPLAAATAPAAAGQRATQTLSLLSGDTLTNAYNLADVLYEVDFVAIDLFRDSNDQMAMAERRLAGGSRQTITEGIENLQFMYGIDADRNGAADYFVPASGVVNTTVTPTIGWRNVVSVRAILNGHTAPFVKRNNEIGDSIKAVLPGYLDPANAQNNAATRLITFADDQDPDFAAQVENGRMIRQRQTLIRTIAVRNLRNP